MFWTEPFNGDHHLLAEVRSLVSRWRINTAIETGTHIGATARGLSEFVASVETIEIDPQRFAQCEHLDQLGNVRRHLGSSPEVLERILPDVDEPVLFYLDAHWNEYWPLLDELKVIAGRGLERVLIVIHDVRVPEKHFGYDCYKGQVLDLDFVEDSLERLYRGPFNHYYNEEAAGAERGVLYVTPRSSSDDHAPHTHRRRERA